jgi:valine--pyruvate aminotransferase
MPFQYSAIGEKISGSSGIVELMDDLGHALSDAGATPVHMMGGGNPAHIPEIQAVWRRRLAEIAADPAQCDRMLTNYDPPAGNTRFRQAVADALRQQYGWPLGAENVAVTCGGQSAFFYLFNLLAGEPSGGGRLRRVLLPLMPEYIGYADQGLAAGLFTSRRPLIQMLGEHQFKYHVDFDALGLDHQGATDDIAAICITRPTNPSGNVLADDEVARLSAFARRRGIPLIIDNAYGEPFPGAVFESIRPMWDPGIILTFSLSKLGLPGVRTGIVVADAEIIRRIASMTAIVGLANTNVGQTLVGPLLESGELVRLSREVVRPFYRAKSEHAQAVVHAEFGASFPYAIHRSEGAFFLWLWFPQLPISSRELYERLKARGVLIVPGEYFFYGLENAPNQLGPWPHASQCVRMTFSQSAETIARGVAIMADELRQIHGV